MMTEEQRRCKPTKLSYLIKTTEKKTKTMPHGKKEFRFTFKFKFKEESLTAHRDLSRAAHFSSRTVL